MKILASIIHPFLFSCLPVVTLYANNVYQCDANSLVRPLLVMCLATAAGLAIHRLLLGDLVKAAIVTSISITYFLVIFRLGATWVVEHLPGFVPFYLPVWFFGGMCAYVLVARGLRKSCRDVSPVSTFLLIVALGLVGVPATTSLYANIENSAAVAESMPPLTVPATAVSSDKRYPDIYYIVLDGYGRQDVLREVYRVDNRAFLNGLRERGFFVASQAHSNYCQTSLSLSSSLNMTYLDEFAEQLGRRCQSPQKSVRLIRHNRLRQFLTQLGYKTVAMRSSYWLTHLPDADFHRGAAPGLSEFEGILFEHSILRPVGRALFFSGSMNDFHRAAVVQSLAELPDAARIASPKFVFAHILSPHPPFVLGADGQGVPAPRSFTLLDDSREWGKWKNSRQQYLRGYGKQVLGLSKLVRRAVDGILANSVTPPIIIIQADHGPGLMLHLYDSRRTNVWERFSILYAMHLPGVDKTKLPHDLSPVNGFRLVLNHYFGTNLPMLEQRALYSTWIHPFAFEDVTDRLSNRTKAQRSITKAAE